MTIFRVSALLLCLVWLSGCTNSAVNHVDGGNSVSRSALVAIIGDFGSGDDSERSVSEMVGKNNPEAVVTVGDNVYSNLGYEKLVGTYYGEFIKRSTFYPATGNHDYELGIENFDAYFGKTSQNRHYKFQISNIEFFVLDSEQMLNNQESLSIQQKWLTDSAAQSTAKFKIVILHHPPYSSSSHHGSTQEMQWDYSKLGINLVISGHDHTYERLSKNGVTYVVDGTGGKTLYECGKQLQESIICLDQNFGALFINSSSSSLSGEFKDVAGATLDSFQIKANSN